MDQREFENGTGTSDVLDSESRRVIGMLSALPRVEAPENFEFRVKARIADGGPSRAPWIPFLKIAAPVGLVLVIALVIVFRGMNTNTVVPVEQETATVNQPSVIQPEPAASEVPSTTAPGPQVSSESVPQPERASASREIDRSGPVRSSSTQARPDRSQGGGSVDSTLKSANTILPQGFESVNPSRPNQNSSVGRVEIAIRDVFQILGVEADFVSGGWKVRSSQANGTAYRAGVRAGDVIEAIDGATLSQGTSFKGEFTGRVLRVRRDGKLLSINLNN